jgi:hypothetical protein
VGTANDIQNIGLGRFGLGFELTEIRHMNRKHLNLFAMYRFAVNLLEGLENRTLFSRSTQVRNQGNPNRAPRTLTF